MTHRITTCERLPEIVTQALLAVARSPQVVFGPISWTVLLRDLHVDCWHDELLTGARGLLAAQGREGHLLSMTMAIDEDLRHPAHTRGRHRLRHGRAAPHGAEQAVQPTGGGL